MAKSGQQWVIRPDAIKRIRVIAGSQTIKASEDSESFDVNKVVIHPSYDTRKGSNDIALIGLKTVIRTMAQNDSPINTVCLPNKGEYLSDVVTTTGWGTTAENGADSYNLKAVDLPLVKSR